MVVFLTPNLVIWEIKDDNKHEFLFLCISILHFVKHAWPITLYYSRFHHHILIANVFVFLKFQFNLRKGSVKTSHGIRAFIPSRSRDQENYFQLQFWTLRKQVNQTYLNVLGMQPWNKNCKMVMRKLCYLENSTLKLQLSNNFFKQLKAQDINSITIKLYCIVKGRN